MESDSLFVHQEDESMDFQTQVQANESTLAPKEEDEIHTQTLEEPFKKDNVFELNEVIKDVIHDTYFLDLKKEKLALDVLPHSQAHKFQIGVGSEKRLLMREIQVQKAFDKGKEIKVLLMSEIN